MRVIRPRALVGSRGGSLMLAVGMLIAGLAAGALTVLGVGGPGIAALTAAAAALGIGVGAAWMVRVLRPDRMRSAASALEELLAPIFDDAYTLVLAPRLPIRDAGRLDGVLVGPAGVRVLTVRSWEGRYRVRGRAWEFDAGRRRGWIRCRTNPSTDAAALADGVSRWAQPLALPSTVIRPTVVFPWERSRIVLEEPIDEIVTADNGPWWAHSIGNVRRLEPAAAARVVESILDAAEPAPSVAPTPTAEPRV